jgi:uncharacterized protein YbgA (DUF1722 family)/uncharacterized protein YbbK (DUF523 family)
MQTFIKPRIVISKCLGFDSCRWNGLMIHEPFVDALREQVESIPVCPEVEIGLGIPRNPIRVVEIDGKPSLLQPSSGREVTSEMNTFSESFLEPLKDIDGFLLKGRSPLCGFKDVKVYGKNGTVAGKGAGLFARKGRELFPDVIFEDEGRLNDTTIREHFLIRIFTFARFRAVRDSHSMKELVRFQAENKLLLMAYNQTVMRELGRITANREGKSPDSVIHDYTCLLPRAFARSASHLSHINVLMHAFGYVSEKLSSEEKSFFLDVLNRYRSKKVPLSVPVGIMQSWIVRFHVHYLEDQTFFHPYPEALVEGTDSMKGGK